MELQQILLTLDEEVKKAQIAIDHGADCLMELSIGGDLDVIRRRVLDMSPLPVGSVPVYQAAIERIQKRRFRNLYGRRRFIQNHRKTGKRRY